MWTMKRTIAAAAVAAGMIGGASAANAGVVVFSDNFDSYSYAINWPGSAKWDVSQGSVDLIGAGTPFSLLPTSYGKYVDLDGTSYKAGGISTTTTFDAGTYELSFVLAGGLRSADMTSKTTTISLGDWSETITLPWNAGPSVYSALVTTAGGVLSFKDASGGNDNIGNLLDDVSVTAVPEASTWAMLLAGFAGLGFAAFSKARKTPIGIA